MWKNVRCLPNGETVSISGAHLGHNLPDTKGLNRYCINLASISGNPQIPDAAEGSKAGPESNGESKPSTSKADAEAVAAAES